MVSPADKGRATVLMHTEEYRKKSEDLLSDQKTYQVLKKDPTKEYKQQLKVECNKLVEEKKIDKKMYHRLVPTAEIRPDTMQHPKFTRKTIP